MTKGISIGVSRLMWQVLVGFGFAVVGLFLPGNPCAQNNLQPSILLANNLRDTVWRTYVDGSVDNVLEVPKGHLQDARTADGFWEADGSLTPSRDNRRIALRARNDVWLFDVETRQRIRITSVGMPSDRSFATVSASPVIWSWDSAKPIYVVSPGDRDGPGMGGREPLKEREARYGFFVHDLASGASQKIQALAGHAVAWLPGDRLLLWSHKGLSVRSIYEPASPPAPDLKEGSPQTFPSADGRRLIATVSPLNRHSQIAELEIENGLWKVSLITPVGAFAEYQWPAFSPTGRKHSYLRIVERVPVKPGSSGFYPGQRLVVDGKPVYAFVGHAQYAWITDQVIAIQVNELQTGTVAIVVVNSESGVEIARRVVYSAAIGKK